MGLFDWLWGKKDDGPLLQRAANIGRAARTGGQARKAIPKMLDLVYNEGANAEKQLVRDLRTKLLPLVNQMDDDEVLAICEDLVQQFEGRA